MATAVLINVVPRYGFSSGIATRCRGLFVCRVFIGAAAADPMGEPMAFPSPVGLLRQSAAAFTAMTTLIRLLVILACALLAWGACTPALRSRQRPPLERNGQPVPARFNSGLGRSRHLRPNSERQHPV